VCYKCEVCSTVMGYRVPLRKHTIYKTRPGTNQKQVAMEIPVCNQCGDYLDLGGSIQDLWKKYHRVIPTTITTRMPVGVKPIAITPQAFAEAMCLRKLRESGKGS
jgi:hypothetical protein